MVLVVQGTAWANEEEEAAEEAEGRGSRGDGYTDCCKVDTEDA